MQTTAAQPATHTASDALDIIRDYLRSELAGLAECGGRSDYLAGVVEHAQQTLRYLDRLEKRITNGRS